MTMLFKVAENIRKADPRLTRKEAIAKAIELYDAIGPQPLPEPNSALYANQQGCNGVMPTGVAST